MVRRFIHSHPGSSAEHGPEEELQEVGRPVRKTV